jgi:hypothetical protein
MKTCFKCKKEFDISHFYKSQNQCKDCTKANVKRCQNLNQARYNKYKFISRDRNKEWLEKQKQVPCIDCGGEFPPCAMHFDHLPGTTKLFGISNKVSCSRARLAEEIAKCEVICANCHSIRTYERGQHDAINYKKKQ